MQSYILSRLKANTGGFKRKEDVQLEMVVGAGGKVHVKSAVQSLLFEELNFSRWKEGKSFETEEECKVTEARVRCQGTQKHIP